MPYLSNPETEEGGVFFVTVPEDHPMARNIYANDHWNQEAHTTTWWLRNLVRMPERCGYQGSRENATRRRKKPSGLEPN